MNKQQQGPLVHIVKRGDMPAWRAWCIRLAAIVLALIACAGVTMLLTGDDPLKIYATILTGAFGTARKTWTTFQNLAILLCISLAVTPAFKMRFWNIGAEGQVLIGGLAAAACMILLGDKIPNWLLIALMTVTSIAAGAVWAAIPAFFKAKWNTNETLFTLMMNYVATQLVAYFAQGRRQDRHHQSELAGRLVPHDLRAEISAQYPHRGRADHPAVHLSQLQQAWL